ncbi:carboxypeptidase-like regulatory domain-containing protein [Lutibacter sp.]
MKKFILITALLAFNYSFSQITIEGFIFDKATNESLPFATIQTISTSNRNYYTISNEDGKFEINVKSTTDSLLVRTIGFKTKKVSISYFKSNKKLYLSPNTYNLNTVLIVAKKDKNYVYNLLSRLLKKYAKKKHITDSKAFLTLTSSAREIPIEIIEGFYNSKQSLSKGIVDFKLKGGRFGQKASFPFYSLNNTDILKDFQLFGKSSNILPLHPGNLSSGAIKWKYKVKMDSCKNCNAQDVSISFNPKRAGNRFFSGTIIFNKETLTIKKIQLAITDPKIKNFTSISNDDSVTPKSVKIHINFNPIDYKKIQSIDFELTMYYKSAESFEIITSNSFLYFYDYNKPFEEPYFTDNINFRNDYDKIMALQSSDDFWNSNYQFPKSFKEEKAINYFKNNGYLINYGNNTPASYLSLIKPSILPWRKDRLQDWKNIKVSINKSDKMSSIKQRDPSGELKGDKVFYSYGDMKRYMTNQKGKEQFKFSYVLDSYLKNGKIQFVTQTLFNRATSFYPYNRTQNKLIYIGVIFDIYEVFNRELEYQLAGITNFEAAKVACDKKFEEATTLVNQMKIETELGLNSRKLERWSERIKLKLNSITE